jgi:hypothetical protein
MVTEPEVAPTAAGTDAEGGARRQSVDPPVAPEPTRPAPDPTAAGRARRAVHRLARPFGLAVAVTVVLRVITDLVALASEYGVDFVHKVGADHHLPIAVWNRWDTGYYIVIAEHGYAPSHGAKGLTTQGAGAHIAFGPLYPLAIRVVHDVLGTGWDTSGQLVSAVALVVALTGLFLLTGLDGTTSRAGTAVFLVAAFPTAFFLLAGYPEALALALGVWAFVAIRRRWWLAAGLLAAGAFLTKYYLLLLVVPLLMEVWRVRRVPDTAADEDGASDAPARFRRIDRETVVHGALAAGPVLLALIAWAGYSDHLDGTPLGFARAQVAWDRSFAWPWTLYTHTASDMAHLRFLDTSTASFMELFDVVTVVALAAMAVFAWFRLRRSYAVLLALGWCVFSFETILMGETREVLVLFPFFIGLAALVEGHPWRERILLALFLPSAYFLIERFVNGRFAG